MLKKENFIMALSSVIIFTFLNGCASQTHQNLPFGNPDPTKFYIGPNKPEECYMGYKEWTKIGEQNGQIMWGAVTGPNSRCR